jgi:hypothetical protein
MHLHVQRIVDQTNADFEEEGSSTRVSIESVRAWKPSRVQTRLTTEPNSWFIIVPHEVKIKVAINNLGDRRIQIPIDFHVTCQDWHLATGKLVIRSIPREVTVTGGSLLEAIVFVRDRINTRIAAEFGSLQQATVPMPLMPCSSLGASDNGTAKVNDDALFWDVPRRVPAPALHPSVEITFDRLKRLPARGRTGTVIYGETEDILLNIFANYDAPMQRHLTMRDGDGVLLELAPIRLDARKYEKLIIIGSVVQQPPGSHTDTKFATSTRAQNYTPGSHVLQIPKIYYIPGDPKPSEVSVPAYELTYTVRFIDSGASHQVDHR